MRSKVKVEVDLNRSIAASYRSIAASYRSSPGRTAAPRRREADDRTMRPSSPVTTCLSPVKLSDTIKPSRVGYVGDDRAIPEMLQDSSTHPCLGPRRVSSSSGVRTASEFSIDSVSCEASRLRLMTAGTGSDTKQDSGRRRVVVGIRARVTHGGTEPEPGPTDARKVEMSAVNAAKGVSTLAPTRRPGRLDLAIDREQVQLNANQVRRCPGAATARSAPGAG